jgi:peptide/nickel transport system ATP-binding protein
MSNNNDNQETIEVMPATAVGQREFQAGETPLLAIDDLHVWYELKKWGFAHAGYVRAVDGVTFDLKQGEAMACVGESGCGKSSLMKAILGLNKITKGEITFDGKSKLTELAGEDMRWYRSQIGYIQQDPYGALAPFMSIQRILEEPLIINGFNDSVERMRRIEKVLEEVKLTPVNEVLHKFPHMLSGGQQQRVVIARAMLLEPKILVADEPVSMLDASVRVEILRLLRGLQESHNLGVIYITHDLSTVKYFSEHIFVMYAGEVVEMGRVNDLLHDPKHPYTHALLEASSDPDANNAKVMREIPPGEPPSLVDPPSGCRFHPRCPHAMQGLCEVERPPSFVVAPDHRVACWLYDPEKADQVISVPVMESSV